MPRIILRQSFDMLVGALFGKELDVRSYREEGGWRPLGAGPRSRSQASSPSREIIGRSPQIKEVVRRVKKFAKYSAHALILGETGTGKELFARLLHDHSGRRGVRGR